MKNYQWVFIILIAVLIISATVIMLNINKEKPTAARIAFVIDDWGYSRSNIDLLFDIDRPVTAAILPNLRYTKDIAEAIRDKNDIYTMILHLPLESKSGKAAESDTITCDMADREVMALLERDVESIPGISGISNHQGSKATENKRLMTLILKDCKKRKLFFIDSLTTPDSACLDIARSIGLKCGVRDVFLDLTDQTDAKNFEAYIKQQIKELAQTALTNKTAIGIGHAKSATLKVIKESIPELEKQGIEIVPVQDLVR